MATSRLKRSKKKKKKVEKDGLFRLNKQIYNWPLQRLRSIFPTSPVVFVTFTTACEELFIVILFTVRIIYREKAADRTIFFFFMSNVLYVETLLTRRPSIFGPL